MVTQQLLDYVQDQVKSGYSLGVIARTLLDNEWSTEDVNSAFNTLGLLQQAEHAPVAEHLQDTFMAEKLTVDKIIGKIIPVVGALFLIIGLGYLIYANAWVFLPAEVRIALGFFASLVIIGTSFTFSDRMRYLADVGIGSGVLLLYGTLIYGSRATETASAVIPELATLFTAILFTVSVAYFASKRNSKVILMLGMIGAYITPFVIGQQDVWVQNVSFNAYLIYFLAVNVAVFLMGREISVRQIIPLNTIGMFFGITTLWGLAASSKIDAVNSANFFTSELVTGVLFMVLVVITMWSVLLSAKRFKESDDGYLSLGYIAPVIWFAFNVANLESLADNDLVVGILYAIIAVSCFMGWHVLLLTKTRFQHTALYAAGLLSAIFSFFLVIHELNVYTSMFVAYVSLIFAGLYVLDPSKTERFVSYCALSLMGSILSIQEILDANISYETLLIVIALLPAIGTYFVALWGKRQEFLPLAKMYSALSFLVALLFVLGEIIDYIDISFLFFYLIPLAILMYVAYVQLFAPDELSHDTKSTILQSVLGWFAFGFFTVFLHLILSIYPAPTDVYLFTHTDEPIDWIFYKGIFATFILFIGLFISRRLQQDQVIKRPSFLLVIFGFSTLVLIGNYIISAVANDIGVSMEHGGPRALATTIWWVAVAIYMLFVGIQRGKKYHAEKLLGLILLAISVGKVILYDIATMGMQNKILVLMTIGGIMLVFSYIVRSKNLLKTEEPENGVQS